MKEIAAVIKEQFNHAGIIFRMSRYEDKATYQSHYLGLAWQILNPAIQIGIYYLVFGLGVNGNRKVDGVPFIIWMLIGITAWFYIPMVAIVIGSLLWAGVTPSVYWLQFIYYFIAMVIFLFAFGLLNATITVLIRDYHIFLQSVLRLLFYVSGPIWDINNRNMPEWLIKLLRLNPFYYLIEGFRDAFFSRGWVWEKTTYT